MPKDKLEYFPELPLDEWESSKITLHLWLQIVGKVKLALMPKRNHWWNITLFPSVRGITSAPIPHEKGSMQFDFDFQKHQFEISTSWNGLKSFSLKDGLSVAKFYALFFEGLEDIGIKPEIVAVPYDHPCKEPFAVCQTYNSYNEEYIQRFWKILLQVDNIFKEFSGKFYGKVSPSQIYWHHMDLAVGRFSGKAGPKMPDDARQSDKEAYSHEVIANGFWAGDENVRGAAFYGYTYPSPQGLDKEPLLPAAASWIESNGSSTATLMYDDLRICSDPKKELMNFLQSSYDAGAKRANWPDGLV